MTVKRRDFQKAAALIHEFLLKITEDTGCAELRDSLNLALLHMQRYYRKLRNRLQTLDRQSNGNHILTQSLRGLSPMTPFRDTPDKFQWKWINLDSPKLANTLPADLNKEFSSLHPVIQAAKAGNNDILMEHIERDPDSILEVDGMGRTALMYAVNFGQLDTVQILLEHEADVNATAIDGSTAVHRACHNGNHEALRILIEYNADLNIQDAQGRHCIHWACTQRDRTCLQLLLENINHGVDVTVQDNDGMTPSMWACRMDNIDHFQLLMDVQTTDYEIEKDNNGKTWMHWSVRRTEPLECLQTLLTEESACIADDEGNTVIHTCTEMGSLPAVKIVMEIAGKSVLEHRDGHNRTPLILATMGGHGEVVNYLLSEGADLSCTDDEGATAWDYACKRQLHYCMLILASYIRQRAREEEAGIEVGQGDSYNAVNSMMDGTLGLSHLQINGDQPMFHGNRPMPPPHPPAEPPTPRTPRTPRVPRPKTPAHPRSSNPTYQQLHPAHADLRPSGVKRSPSTPDANDSGTFFERQSKPSSASKRMKNEHQSPEREGLISVMSMDSGDPAYPSRGHSAQSVRSNTAYNDHPEMENNSEFVDGADEDNSRVSIDAMDVSDFEADIDEDIEKVKYQGHHGTQNGVQSNDPSPSPRPPPQPHPRHQQQPASSPFSYAPKARPPTRHGENSPTPRPTQRSPPPNHSYNASNHNSQSWHDEEISAEAYVAAPHSGDGDSDEYQHAHNVHYPTGAISVNENRVVPPAHLSPLHTTPPAPRKKKKKKKKERAVYLQPADDLHGPSRGYIQPIPPPLHSNTPPGRLPSGAHPPPAMAREQQLLHGRSEPGGREMIGIGNSSTLPGSSTPMPKKRQTPPENDQRPVSAKNYIGLSIDGKKKPSHLANAPPIATQSSGPRSPSAHQVPQLPQAQPRQNKPLRNDKTLPNSHQGRSQSETRDFGEDREQLSAKGKRFQKIQQNESMETNIMQNGPVHKQPPGPTSLDMGNVATRGQHPPSPRGRRPPSGSLGGASQKPPAWTKAPVTNGRLPPYS